MRDFEAVLRLAGGFGPFQKRLALLGALPVLFIAFLLVGVVFLAYTPPHWCQTGAVRATCAFSEEEVRDLTVPRTGARGAFSECLKFDAAWNGSALSCDVTADRSAFTSASRTRPCDEGWVFAEDRTTIVTEFSLLCGRSWLVDVTQVSLALGYFCGALVIGFLSDRFGRKPCFLASVLGLGVSGVALVLAPLFPLLLVFRCLQGFFAKGVRCVSYVLVVECLGAEHRKVVSVVVRLLFSLGLALLPVLAFFISSWRLLQLVITLPLFLFLLYRWVVPESPRWLLSQKKTREALEVLRHVAQCNGRPLPDQLQQVELLLEHQEDVEQLSFQHLFKTPKMRKHTFILLYAWFTGTVVFQGLILRLGLSGNNNLHLDFLVSALVELPSGLIFYALVDRAGRRPLMSALSLTAAAACVSVVFISAELSWLRRTVAIIGRLAVAIGNETLNFANAELFPTPLRNLGVSVCSSASDVGSVAAPFLLYRLSRVWPDLPLLVYGGMSILYAALVLMLPEMKGVALPETLQDVENMGRWVRPETPAQASSGAPSHQDVEEEEGRGSSNP